MPKLPKIIYVYEEKDGKDSYLLAFDNPEEAQDGKVGVYELVNTVTKSTKTVME